VFEKSAFAAEVGAALALTPNGAKVLSSLGFSFTKARAVRLTFWNVLHGETLQLLNGVDMTAAKARFGAEPWAVHRVDLHNELLRLATSTEEAGIPVKLHLSSEVVEATTSGKIVLRDGSTRTADLVIGADGVKSAVRKTVTQEPAPSATTGSSAFRFLVDTQQLKADKTLATLVERLHGTANLLADVKETAKERHMMAYTCRKYV
jgi:salicylate hydroxylase